MTQVVGALFAAVAVSAAACALVAPSRVGRHLARIAPDRVRRTRTDGATTRVRTAIAIVAALVATVGMLTLSLPPMLVIVAAYGGFVGPRAIEEHRDAVRLRAAERALALLIERLHALLAAGRPLEGSLTSLANRTTGSALLDGVLRASTDAYALGAPMMSALAARARSSGLDRLARLADEMERARDLGHGTLGVIADGRDALRARERARALEAASKVEGRLMLVLVLCYVPALMLLVVIPLFMRLLDGLLL